jgi:hypothetical protein
MSARRELDVEIQTANWTVDLDEGLVARVGSHAGDGERQGGNCPEVASRETGLRWREGSAMRVRLPHRTAKPSIVTPAQGRTTVHDHGVGSP